MRGRTTLTQVNTAIDEFNKALSAKYHMLCTPKAGRTDAIRKQIAAFKEQENADTKGGAMNCLYQVQHRFPRS